ncbi:MAG: hypothetical protein ACYCX3_01455 [Thermoleophilia bacterium]
MIARHEDTPPGGSDADARRLLNGRLGFPLSDEEVGFLRLQGILGEIAQAGGDSRTKNLALERTVETVRNLRVAQGRPVGEEPGQAGDMARDDGHRRYALSRLLALDAEGLPEVVAFRARHLPGGVLDWEDMGAWIRKKAQDEGAPSEYVEVALPPDTTVRATVGGMVAESAVPVRELPIEGGVRVKLLKYGLSGGALVQGVPVRAGGVLDELRRLGARLAKSYSWTADQATVFALSGVTPLVAGIRLETDIQTEHPAASRITLTVDPVVSPGEVLAIYSELRQKVLKGTHRPLSEKHQRLAVFAAERRPGATWAEVMEAWNHAHEEHTYTTVTVFARDCTAAKRRLLRPKLDPDALL